MYLFNFIKYRKSIEHRNPAILCKKIAGFLCLGGISCEKCIRDVSISKKKSEEDLQKINTRKIFGKYTKRGMNKL